MKLHTPNYYKHFSCIGGSCKDNCCIGWEIDIDEHTYARYMAEPGEFGDRLRGNVSASPVPHFVLQGETERCPFLNGHNLCDIYITLGREALCRICTLHPRFADQFGDVGELGLGLACEEAARLILCAEEPFALTEQAAPSLFDDAEPIDAALLASLLTARQHLFTLLQDVSLSLPTRLTAALLYATALQNALDSDPAALHHLSRTPIDPAALPRPLVHYAPEGPLDALRETFAQLDYMDIAWADKVTAALGRTPAALRAAAHPVTAALPAQFLQNFAVYLLYRYFLKSVRDRDILGKLQLTVASTVLLYALVAAEQTPTLCTALRQAQLFSKEVEYSEDNLAILGDAFIDDPALFALPLAALAEAVLP